MIRLTQKDDSVYCRTLRSEAGFDDAQIDEGEKARKASDNNGALRKH